MGVQFFFIDLLLLPELYIYSSTVYPDLLNDKPRGRLLRVARVRVVGGRYGLVHGRAHPHLDPRHRTARILQGARLPRGKFGIIPKSIQWMKPFYGIYCWLFSFFFWKFLEDISPFRGITIHLFWTFGDVCPGVLSQGGFLTCTLSCLSTIPEIHLWCDTCRLYRGQHGSQL